VSQLAEQHRDQLRPATEAFGGSFGAVFLHQRRELQAWEMPQQLIKQAHGLYHSVRPPVGDSAAEPLVPKMARRWNNYRRACFLDQFKLFAVLDKSDRRPRFIARSS
jgi:hypothetical protein